MVGSESKLFFYTLLLIVAVPLIAIAVLVVSPYVFPNRIGLYPYLGERDIDPVSAAGKVLELAQKYWEHGADVGTLCGLVVSAGRSVAYVSCEMFSETIVFPRSGGEKLELGIYVGTPRDFRKVWGKTVKASFTLPNDIIQGVYRVPGTDTYYFRVAPGLPICLEIEQLEKNHTDVLVLIRVWINGREIKHLKEPGIVFWISDTHKLCFDAVSMSLNSVARGNLEWETYKPLMDLKGSVNITYLVELYVDKSLLDKNMTINIAIGPPYIQIHK